MDWELALLEELPKGFRIYKTDNFVIEPTPAFLDGLAVAFYNPAPAFEPDLNWLKERDPELAQDIATGASAHLGLGVGGNIPGVTDGFGILALASVGPILTVLSVGLYTQHVEKKVNRKLKEDAMTEATLPARAS